MSIITPHKAVVVFETAKAISDTVDVAIEIFMTLCLYLII
jgi:hypothetical protein